LFFFLIFETSFFRTRHFRLYFQVAFISLSGFSGLLIGFRRSAFRKFLYVSALSAGATAICFPNEAKQLSNQTLDLSKYYLNRVYRDYVWPTGDSKASKQPAQNAKPEAQKDTIVRVDANSTTDLKGSVQVKENMGQSSEQDKDMYTTRSK
jgi:hypothetical protein